MSAISGLGGGGMDMSAMRQAMFKQIDTNGNGKVSKDEFVSGRPKGVSESQAAELFGKIDSKGTGEVTQSELDSGLEKNKPSGMSGLGGNLSSDMMATLLQMLSGGDSSSSNASSASSSDSDLASKIFSQIDADEDGKVTKDEFVKNRPQFISEADATKQFDAIDKEGTGSITKDQFAANAPQPPSFGGGGFGDSSSTDNSGDLVSQLLEAINSYTKNSYSGANTNLDLNSLLKTSA